MNAQDAIVVIAALFIVGMIWLRTRTVYALRGTGPLRLQPVGRFYFGAAIAVLAAGWVAAPSIGRAIWPETAATPTLMRVAWCIATYYVFIVVHRILKMRGSPIFRPGDQNMSL
jgi:hypothetical protein